MLCPGCGSCHYESNLIDETPFVAAAEQAPQLRHYGDNGMVVGVLGTLGIVKVANFIRKRWRCLVCGAKFDD